ncbi:MAG TPA: hypothetical protein ENK23_02680 [Sorangium sp.]|nr:hypothetical protein [Sorangium sp.]
MKYIKNIAFVAVAASILGGCAYGGAAADGGKVVVLRNDSFLFGALRSAYVCQITDGGLTNCNENEAP